MADITRRKVKSHTSGAELVHNPIHSQVYVKHILSSLPPKQLHLGANVLGVSSSAEPGLYRVQVSLSDTHTEVFDHVILACHSDSALKLLRTGQHGSPTADEERILGAFTWNKNEAVLHSDAKVRLSVDILN